MNWDAIGAAGEIVGALAVVVSVFYLAAQVRKQTEEERLSATRQLSELFLTTIGTVQEDKEFAGVYLRAVQDYDSIQAEDRIRVALFFQRGFRILEQQHLHTRRGNVDPVYFESMNLAFFEWLTFPGVQKWWELSRDLFEAEFRKFVDAQIMKAKQKGYNSSFNELDNFAA
ncbi:MAG: hypothetical protein ACU84Q_10805 [Gammaproteobacteria bacterium]